MATVSINGISFYTNEDSAQAGAIDLESGGATKIRSNGDGGSDVVVVTVVGIDVIAASSVTDTAVITVGTNNPDYDNILSEHAIRPIAGFSERVAIDPSIRIAGSDEVFVNVKVPGSATSFTAVVSVGIHPYQVV